MQLIAVTVHNIPEGMAVGMVFASILTSDAEKDFMGLTTFSGDFPTKKDVVIAKNYLSEKELKVLNNLVSAYFDLAEINAIEHNTMYMSESALCHLFKQEMKISLKQYILQKKMLNAKALLQQGMSPGAVAEACGYKNYPSFYKIFLKVTGLTPAQVTAKE